MRGGSNSRTNWNKLGILLTPAGSASIFFRGVLGRKGRERMKRFASFVVPIAAALIFVPALAGVTPQEADRLVKDLTPVGAEKAGNADGTIPAYEGTDAPLPGWEWGKVRSQYWKYKDEKPLFTIDASNVDKYAAHLTDGQITALKTVK